MHRYHLLLTTIAATLTAGHPHHQAAKRAISPDGTCGTNGYTCPGDLPCCSQWGYCGSGADYCGVGCRSAFGTCNGGGAPAPSTNPNTSPNPPPSSAGGSKISPDGTCGPANGYSCAGDIPCCSQWGYCGSGTEYCGASCQSGFGTCNGGGGPAPTVRQTPSPSPSPNSGGGGGSNITPDGTCGPANGYSCAGDLPCCSQWGYCGSGADYCGAACQSGFGTCNGGGAAPTLGQTALPSPSPNSGGGRPKIGSVPYGSVIFSCVNNGDIAITFDDGPYIYTPQVLDVLARYNVKATFFIVGNNGNGDIDKVPQWSDIVKRMYNEGHQVASHTFAHPDLSTLSSEARKEQMYRLEAAIENIIGVSPTYMRPPYLSCDSACQADMDALAYHVVSTNLDTKDYINRTPELIDNSKRTFDEFTASDPASISYIVLNHDVHRTTAEILTEHEIQRLTSRGYRAVTVGECLGDPPANWYRTAQPLRARNPVVAPRGSATTAELEAMGFAPPTVVCKTVDGPNSIEKLMRLV